MDEQRIIPRSLAGGFTGIVLATVALVLPGCQLPKTGPLRDRPDWGAVRSQVKLQLADKQMTGGAFADATRTLKEAIALDPAQPRAYARLAEAQMELGNLASAQETLNLARTQNLSSAELAYMQGVVDEQQEQTESAHQNYAAARKLDAKNVDYVVAEAEALVEQERPREALTLLESVRGKVDDEATIELLAGRIAVLVGDDEKALRHYRAALAHNATNNVVREELGLLLARLKRCNEALPFLNESVERNPEAFGEVYRALAQCLLDNNDPQGVVAGLRGYLKKHPTDGAAHLLYAQAAIATNDLLAAEVALDAASRHHTHRGTVELLRAVIDFKRGDMERAEARLASMGDLGGDDPEILCLIGEMRLSQERTAEARTYFERALRVDPQNSWAKRRMRDTG